jgi:hypothetical protein
MKNLLLLPLSILLASPVVAFAPIPNLSACYPAGFGPPKNVYAATSNGRTFMVVDAPLQKKSEAISRLVFLQGRSPCKFLGNRPITLLAYMPRDAAVSIARQRLESMVNKVGRAAFQAYLDEDLSDSDEATFIYPEEAEAYKQLGLRASKKTSVVRQPCEVKSPAGAIVLKTRLKDPQFAKEYKARISKVCPPIKNWSDF